MYLLCQSKRLTLDRHESRTLCSHVLRIASNFTCNLPRVSVYTSGADYRRIRNQSLPHSSDTHQHNERTQFRERRCKCRTKRARGSSRKIDERIGSHLEQRVGFTFLSGLFMYIQQRFIVVFHAVHQCGDFPSNKSRLMLRREQLKRRNWVAHPFKSIICS